MDKRNFYCAGILPYQVNENGEIYILLGQDENGKWSDFGGKSEPCDNNNVKNTAIREFFEETLNSVIDCKALMNIIEHENNFKLIHARTIKGSPYYMFILRLPMVNTTREKFLSARRLISHLKEKNDIYHLFDTSDSEWKFLEKKDVKWISLDTILLCLDDPKVEKQTGWILKDIFKSTLERNKQELVKLNINKGF